MIHLRTDSVKSRRGSQPEAVSGTPVERVARSAPGRHSGASGCSAHLAPGFGAHEDINLHTGHSTQLSEEEVTKGAPKTDSEGSKHGSAWERTGEGSKRAIGRALDGGVTIQSV